MADRNVCPTLSNSRLGLLGVLNALHRRMRGMSLRDGATQIVTCLRAAGFEAFFVGGCVRDIVLGAEPHDYDIATSALPDDVRRLFPDIVEVGAQFGVMRVQVGGNWFEVATFRRDLSYTDGRRPDAVAFTDARGDVERRDFTINGLLYDPLDGRIIDYVGGQEDVRRRLVRCIGEPAERFEEDKLRLLRAVRFAARLDYEIDGNTFEAIQRAAAGITAVSAERIGAELVNMFTGPHANRALQLLEDTGLLVHVLPEVHAMVGVRQPEQFHPEGDVFQHTKEMLALMNKPGPELALAVLLHDVGKPLTFSESDRIRFNEHAKTGADMARNICQRLRMPNDVTEMVGVLVATHMHFLDVRRMRRSRLVRFLREPYFAEALELHRLDCLASHGSLETWEFCKRELEALGPMRMRPPRLLTGHDLIEMGHAAGPRLREILTALEDAQLEGRVSTRDEAIEFVNHNFPANGKEVR